MIVDTVGTGKRTTTWNEAGQPIDPIKETCIPYGMYTISWSPPDGSVWGSNLA